MATGTQVCRQCNGTGKLRNLSYEQDPNGATVGSATSGGATCPPSNEYACTQCNATGMQNSFGSY